MTSRKLYKQYSNNYTDRKKRDQNGTSFSTRDSFSSSSFTAIPAFNGYPSPSLRSIEPHSETIIDKQRSPLYQDSQCQKSLSSFSEITLHISQQEVQLRQKQIREQNDESFSSDGEEHCIWDNSEAESFGINFKDFLNSDNNPFTFYQLYSIRSQLYQQNRVLRSTTIEEINTISKFYKKPIKFTELMNQQTHLDKTCKLFQQLPALYADQNSQGASSNNSANQSQQNGQFKTININCGQSRNKVEVKNIDFSQIKQESEHHNETYRTLIRNKNKTLQSNDESTPKKILTSSVVSPCRTVPIKKLDLTSVLNSFGNQAKTMTEFDTNSDHESQTSSKIQNNIPKQKLIQLSSSNALSPKKNNQCPQLNYPKSRQQNEYLSVERNNQNKQFSSSSSKNKPPISFNHNIKLNNKIFQKQNFQSPILSRDNGRQISYLPNQILLGRLCSQEEHVKPQAYQNLIIP